MSEKNLFIDSLLADEKIQSLLNHQDEKYLEIALGISSDSKIGDDTSITKLTFLLTMYALSNPDKSDYIELAYKLLKTLPLDEESTKREWNELVNIPIPDENLSYYFLLCSVALYANKTASARLLLAAYEESTFEMSNWEERVFTSILRALLFLVRKQKGYDDIRKVIQIIEKLQEEQKVFEETYLDNFTADQQTRQALWLVALYHTSKAIVETAKYILQGYNYPNRRIDAGIRPHMEIAKSLAISDRMQEILEIIETDLQILIKNCIWNGTTFNDKLRKLCQAKGEKGVLELLPSQRDAMTQGLFDIAANAIILQMPTSAGKTMLAEFNIAVTKSQLPDSKIVYVVPSRALVNQIYHDLRSDLSYLGIEVEKTSSVNEVDPSEDSFLKADEIDVLVSTPEKLDLLIRRNHPSVENVSLFIVDEAHMIREGERGARLELLMSILRRERPNAKYLLLSPFLPGDKAAIKEWLGGGNDIKVDWKPAEKAVLGLKVTAKKVTTEMIPSPYGVSGQQAYSSTKNIDLDLQSSGTKSRILEYYCKHYSAPKKTQLILCGGRGYADNAAQNIYQWIDAPSVISDDIRIVQKYLEEEIGCTTLFSKLLSKGIAVHHAGLSDETRQLVEHLIRECHIQYVCATTTVAEGVNFPVSSVYFDTYRKGGSSGVELSSNEFWNIAGRAGRTMVDDFGRIVLPFNSSQNAQNGKNIIAKSAEALTSVLSKLFDNRYSIMQMLETKSNKDALRKLAYDYTDSFDPLFQYFIHLLRVSNNEYLQDVEDLFKDTFLYSSLSPVEQREFIALCRKIYQSIEAEYSAQTGAVGFADKTGFSVPSVLRIMNSKAHNQGISELDSWEPENLFNKRDSSNLAEKISVIAELPETKLGTDSPNGPFDPDLVAKMLIAWVRGEKLNTISSIHPNFVRQDETQQVSEFVKYMNEARFKASWGLSALEGIVKGINDDIKDSYVPSYVYFGVDNPKSLALRMIGIPRGISTPLSQVITGDVSSYSFKKLRETINSLPLSDWDAIIPNKSKLTGPEWQRIINILMKGK